MKGQLITLEGCEGCGKSTQTALLLKWLQEAKGCKVEQLREPGGTTLGEKIRHLLKHDVDVPEMTPEAELLLFTASRAELVRQKILPTLERGTWILCDRFIDSTTVYQGMGHGLNLELVDAINQFAIGQCVPALTLVIDLPIEESQYRMKLRESNSTTKDRMETMPVKFYESVIEGYRYLSRKHPERVKLIQGSGSQEEVFDRICQEVNHAFFKSVC